MPARVERQAAAESQSRDAYCRDPTCSDREAAFFDFEQDSFPSCTGTNRSNDL